MKEGITYIGGKAYKKCKVVMLPTKNAAYIHKNYKTKILIYEEVACGRNDSDHQHLYIISDEEIKAGDWFLTDDRDWITDNNGNPIWLLKKCAKVEKGWIFAKGEPDTGLNPDWSKKIIATTDSYLGLARPSDDFIRKYCESNGAIKDVLVEYIIEHHDTSELVDMNGVPNGKSPTTIDIKVSPDNTITIKPIKDSWNREEVIDLIQKFWLSYEKNELEYIDNKDKWIEQNL